MAHKMLLPPPLAGGLPASAVHSLLTSTGRHTQPTLAHPTALPSPDFLLHHHHHHTPSTHAVLLPPFQPPQHSSSVATAACPPQHSSSTAPPSSTRRRTAGHVRHSKARTAAPLDSVGFAEPSTAPDGPRREYSPLQDEGLPYELCALADPACPVSLPPPGTYSNEQLDNWRLDKLVATLGRSRSTWRRSLILYEWLKESSKPLDDRLCTTLIRVCADHSDAVSALAVYEWMRAPRSAGGAALKPTTYTYTAAMRAALGANLLERALQVWNDCQQAGVQPDSRLCITYMDVCTRLGHIDRALQMYTQMRNAPPNSSLAPCTVHAFTAAMRAATEGGRWARALDIWADLRSSGCQATGHAYAAAISACAAGQQWQRAVALFDDMAGAAGIRPDVVSCTALVTALASAGEADKAEAVVQWMLAIGLKPNVRTYTALLTAMGNAQQWTRAVDLLFTMQTPEAGSVTPNAYTYSALLKALGEHGQWQLAEALFDHLEQQVLWGTSTGSTELTGDPLLGASGPGAAAALGLGSSLQPQLQAARTRLTALAVVAEGLQKQQADARALQLAELQASSQLQLATLQAQSAATAPGITTSITTPTPLQQPPVMPQVSMPPGSAPLTPPNTAAAAAAAAAAATAAGGMGSRRWPSSGSLDSSSSSSLEAGAGGLSGGLSGRLSGGGVTPSELTGAGSRLSNDGSITGSELSSSGSSAGIGGAALSSSPPSDEGADSVRSWASPAQLNGLDLRVPPTSAALNAAAQPQLPQQLSAPSPRPSTLDSLLEPPAPNTNTSAAFPSPTLFPPSTAPAPPPSAPLPPSNFSLFSTQLVGTPQPTPAMPFLPSNPFGTASQQPFPLSSSPSLRTSTGLSLTSPAPSGSAGPVLNEVVCGALMLAYERAGKWQDTVGVLQRARALGLRPNTVMLNTAISAAGKAGQLEVAEALFEGTLAPDGITFEAFIAACGIAGAPEKAERTLQAMQLAGFKPRDFAYAALIAAHSLAGQHDKALSVRMRARREGLQPSVHVYNASLAVCERVGNVDLAVDLLQSMHKEGVEPNFVTHQLMAVVGRQGVQSVEQQQLAAATLSALCAAAGSLLIKVGLF